LAFWISVLIKMILRDALSVAVCSTIQSCWPKKIL